MKVVTVAVENGETRKMETLADVPRLEDGTPLWPGDPDRHDAGAGDRLDLAIVENDWQDEFGWDGKR